MQSCVNGEKKGGGRKKRGKRKRVPRSNSHMTRTPLGGMGADDQHHSFEGGKGKRREGRKRKRRENKGRERLNTWAKNSILRRTNGYAFDSDHDCFCSFSGGKKGKEREKEKGGREEERQSLRGGATMGLLFGGFTALRFLSPSLGEEKKKGEERKRWKKENLAKKKLRHLPRTVFP